MKDISKYGTHEYEKSIYANHERLKTFSVNIFKWIYKDNPKNGLKKSPCVVRVSGPTSDPDKVYLAANEIVCKLNNDAWSGKKSVTVK